jgi:hypothetical protein
MQPTAISQDSSILRLAKTSLQRRGVKTTMQEKENGDVDGRCVSYNTLEIATECYNALSQTPAIHGRSIFILEVLLLK